ncbi:MAG: undecaprenyldiphospho-muramoylpentapeptide beta-N-acetylglucosaminyltransferase [Pseudomonadota bacterium]
MTEPLVLITAGGTGGHVYPALAVAEELLHRGYRVEWLGTRDGLESRVVPEAGIKLHYLPVRGLRGKSIWQKLRAISVLGIAVLKAFWLVLIRRPACVLGLGGYVAGPAGVAAWVLRKPLVIHEQNSVAGTANRMLAPLADRVLAGFPEAFSEDRDVEVVGNPLREELVEASDEAVYDYDGKRHFRLLVLGGSQGAAPINEVVPGAIQRLKRESDHVLEVFHQTGEEHIDDVRERYGELLELGVEAEPYIEDMAGAYAWSDLVLCRGGALTVAEVALMGRPAVFVPLPQAIDNHQTHNARSLTDNGAGIMMNQAELDSYTLVKLLLECIDAPDALAQLAAAARGLSNADATLRVADVCEDVMHE